MKTKLTFACLLLSATLMAQVSNLPTVLYPNDNMGGGNYYGIVPQSLSYDGTNRVYVRSSETTVDIYTNAFTPVKTINITPSYYKSKNVTEQRQITGGGREVIGENVVFSYSGDRSSILYDYNETGLVPDNWNNDSVKNYIENVYYPSRGGSISIIQIKSHPEGGVMFLPNLGEPYTQDGVYYSSYYEYDKYGKAYPDYYFWWSEGNYLYECYNVYYQTKTIYGDFTPYTYSEWEVTETDENIEAGKYGLPFVNYDNDVPQGDIYGDGLCLTQTLFNEDEKYEYLSFINGSYEKYGSGQVGPCWNVYNDPCPETTRLTFMSAYYSGFNIMSEDGNTLQSVTFSNGFTLRNLNYVQIIKLSNEFYIICTGSIDDNDALLIYKINRSNSGASVQQVSEPQRISGAYKFLRNGHAFIQNGDETYTIQGQKVK